MGRLEEKKCTKLYLAVLGVIPLSLGNFCIKTAQFSMFHKNFKFFKVKINKNLKMEASKLK